MKLKTFVKNLVFIKILISIFFNYIKNSLFKRRLKLTFNKEDGRWYIYLPNWKGAKYDLEMVEGADLLLDFISEHSENVTLIVSIKEFRDSNELIMTELGGWEGGAYYNIKKFGNVEINLDIWLCSVMEFMFGYMPEQLYIKKYEK